MSQAVEKEVKDQKLFVDISNERFNIIACQKECVTVTLHSSDHIV